MNMPTEWDRSGGPRRVDGPGRPGTSDTLQVGAAKHTSVAMRVIPVRVPSVPALVWGRDEGQTGDMWASRRPAVGHPAGTPALRSRPAMKREPMFGRGGRRRSLQPILDLSGEGEPVGRPTLGTSGLQEEGAV